MSIRIKIIIILIALVAFVGISLFDKWQQYEDVNRTQPLYALATNIASLVFELQKERGLSSGFIGSQGTIFSEALKTQRHATDSHLLALMPALKSPALVTDEATLTAKLSALGKDINRLYRVRKSVDQVTSGDASFLYYSNVNAQCLQIIELMTVIIHDVKLAQLINAYSILLQIQESAGQERGAINAVLTSGKLDIALLQSINGFVFEQQEMTDKFLSIATPQYGRLLRQLMDDPIVKEIEWFRASVIGKGKRDEQLNEIQTLIGYGGLIHAFKNFVLRGHEVYAAQVDALAERTHEALSRFRDISGLSPQENEYIDAIQRSIRRYQHNVILIRDMLAQGASIGDIDAAVKVDDEPALSAISHLRQDIIKLDSVKWFDIASQRIDRLYDLNVAILKDITLLAGDLKRRVKQTTQLYFSVFLTALGILLLLTILLFKRAVGEVIRIAETLVRMRTQNAYAQILDVKGHDEIAELTLAYNALIDDRNRSEEELRRAAAVFENATDGVIITDAQGAIVTVNHAVTEITGYSEEEVLGTNPNIFKSDRHAPSFFQAMWASLEQQDHWRGEIWNRRKNGEIFPCWQSISAVRDGDAGEIKHYVSIMSDITAIKQSQERLQHLVHHDPLTNLPNRLLFNARLEHALERAHREKSGIGVMFLDLDNFKPINDGLGHPMGDKVLQSVAERLTAQVREEDTVARIAGDEFAVILEETTDSQNAAHVAGKILSAFDAPFQIEGQKLHLTTSIGISLYPEDGKDVTTLVKNADVAMYRAKERGKNRYCFYTLDFTVAALERLQLENDLRVALKRNEFMVYYQPQYSLTTGRLTGAEALVRWQHPEMGLVPPDRFISIAESIGLIIPIGRWVLHEACAQTKAWQKAGHAMERIGINVAGQQIQRGDFVKTVRKVLEETGLEPQCLELEITESFVMQQAGEAISTLEELRDLGVMLAIDDFGTGYSSLSYLKRLPINKLKIDRSFIKDIPQNADDKAIAKAIIALGKSMQLRILAEGVETEEQKGFVSLEGCDEVQGYYYSRPVPEKDFLELLKNPK